jgi:hypothetical protein
MRISQYPKNADGTPMDLQVGVLTDSTGNNGARLASNPLGPDGAPIDAVGLVLVDGDGNPAVLSAGVADRATLAGYASGNDYAMLLESPMQGLFTWSNDNLSQQVANDAGQGSYVAPTGDTSGATGAWERVGAPEFTIATLPGPKPGLQVFVSDAVKDADPRFLGTIAYSDGTNWHQVANDNIIEAPTPAILFQNGEAGAWYDLDASHGYLFQDTVGLTPVTAAGQTVGLIAPVYQNLGLPLNSGTEFTDATPWTITGGYYSINTGTGKLIATNATGGGSITQAIAVADLAWMKIVVVVDSITSGNIRIRAGDAFNPILLTTAGTKTLYVQANTTANGLDPTLIIDTTIANSNWVIDSVTVYPMTPFVFRQLTAGNRPTYQVGADGIPYVDFSAAGKTMDMGNATGQAKGNFAFPAFFGMIFARVNMAGTNLLVNNGGTAGFSFGDPNAVVNAMSVGSQKGATFHSVGTRTGASPTGMPTPLDLLIEVGHTSSFCANGPRSVPYVTGDVAAGQQRSILNNFVGTEVTNSLNITIANGRWFGGFIRMGAAVSEDLRFKAGHALLRVLNRQMLRADDLFQIIGQSNAMGVGNYLTAPAVPFGNGVEYLDDGQIKPFREPMQHAYAGQVASTGSAWGAFCNRWHTETGRVAMIAGSAFSGEGLINGSIETYPASGWLNGNILTDRAALKLAACLDDYPNVVFRGWIYHGGENDVSLSFTVAEYKQYLKDFLVKLRTKCNQPNGKLLICSLDNATGSPPAYAIMRQAMIDAAAEDPGIELIVPYQNYLARGGAWNDGIHLQQQALDDEGTIAATNAAAVWGL